MTPLQLHLSRPAATENLATRLAPLLRPGDCLLLAGPYGAGKTTFCRALIRTLLADPAHEVPSPSFSLVQSYAAGRLTVHHFDLWRLDGPAALTEIGFWEALADVTLVEWPERLSPHTIPGALHITLSPGADDTREAVLTGWDATRLGLISQPPTAEHATLKHPAADHF